MNQILEVKMAFAKETKNKVKYEADSPTALVSEVYISKRIQGPNLAFPQVITVRVEA